jgi:hypothetical protein
MAPFSYVGHIILRKTGRYNELLARLTKTSPALEVGEVAIKLRIDLPAELFTRPALEAKINIPQSEVPKSIINVDIQDNIEQAIREATGVEIKFTVIPDEANKECSGT